MGKGKIAVDFDGVVHHDSNWTEEAFKNGEVNGKPVKGVAEALKRLSAFFEIIIFTARPLTGREMQRVIFFLERNSIPFSRVTNIKPRADYYIDDKAITFSTWENILSCLMP